MWGIYLHQQPRMQAKPIIFIAFYYEEIIKLDEKNPRACFDKAELLSLFSLNASEIIPAYRYAVKYAKVNYIYLFQLDNALLLKNIELQEANRCRDKAGGAFPGHATDYDHGSDERFSTKKDLVWTIDPHDFLVK